jgi:hypothetical protein
MRVFPKLMSITSRRLLTSCAAVIALLTFAWSVPAGASGAPTLKITSGPYHGGEKINLSVGPNHRFKAYSRIIVLECADPHGKTSNLPTSAATCDGNTVQGNTILVKPNGSFSESGYKIFTLPNVSLDETKTGQPVCSKKKSCVLYIGENQENFSSPKMFSPPFEVQSTRKRS